MHLSALLTISLVTLTAFIHGAPGNHYLLRRDNTYSQMVDTFFGDGSSSRERMPGEMAEPKWDFSQQMEQLQRQMPSLSLTENTVTPMIRGKAQAIARMMDQVKTLNQASKTLNQAYFV